MARRRDRTKPPADLHLWHEVARTVTPLRPARPGHKSIVDLEGEPLPVPPANGAPPPAKPRKLAPGKSSAKSPAMPSYQPDHRPGRTPRPGIEPNLRQRLHRGRETIDGRIDLHGMRQVEAHAALTRFIHARHARGDRTLLVITGKGIKKMEDDAAILVERGVLRSMLPIWLSEPGLAPLVAGWDVAVQRHGGDGAFYVRLRRERGQR